MKQLTKPTTPTHITVLACHQYIKLRQSMSLWQCHPLTGHHHLDIALPSRHQILFSYAIFTHISIVYCRGVYHQVFLLSLLFFVTEQCFGHLKMPQRNVAYGLAVHLVVSMLD
ncbi:hypothetical protein LSH36_141g10047 [Paralvinella palmiformis]|uniref:Uncharacterized protein n=1 Tax=Paralvinella palmiformis TaxID=53620 RepID=A0AAD9N969_9ANNE|nr:hypothetical protein LSH36_141g10047 [Paralvinella palmiformis]